MSAGEPPVRTPAIGRGAADSLRRRMLAVADAMAVLGALLALGVLPGSVGEQSLWAAVLLPAAVVLAKLEGLYDRDHRVLRPLAADEIPSLVTWATACTAVTFAALALSGASVSASAALRAWLVILVSAPLLRAVARQLWRRVVPAERVLIIGRGEPAEALRRKLELFPDIHVRAHDEVETVAMAMPRLDDVDRIVLVVSDLDEDAMAGLLSECRERSIKLGLVPPARALFNTAVRLDHVAELPIVQYNTWPVARSTLWLKRVVDVAVSMCALVLLSPLFMACAIAIRLDSGGSPFFRQQRAGRDGVPFTILKFRTMTSGADRRLEEVVNLSELEQPAFKLQSDPRVTRVGRVLRKASLDELPQLVNVLLGPMSLVGPRPEQVEIVAMYEPEDRLRLSVKPGMTGPMQIYGRGDLSFQERIAVEREYIENVSLRRDAHILISTLSIVARGRGAY
jgi:exopolysaccharide biosynthesis polyprenyl glycosylphosphotransferase